MAENYISHASLNGDVRTKKAQKLISILSSFIDLGHCDILDIGTGSGHIAHELGHVGKTVVSVNLTDERVVKDGYRFIQIKDEKLPFEDKAFDVVISNHVIEHIPNQRLHIHEIFRVLRKEGILYLATPNKYALIEPHFMMPFLSWLPRRFASGYLRCLKNQTWDVYPLSFSGIKKLVSSEFVFNDMSIEVVKNPRKYNLDMYPFLHPLLRLLPTAFFAILRFVFPSHLIVLHKKCYTSQTEKL